MVSGIQGCCNNEAITHRQRIWQGRKRIYSYLDIWQDNNGRCGRRLGINAAFNKCDRLTTTGHTQRERETDSMCVCVDCCHALQLTFCCRFFCFFPHIFRWFTRFFSSFSLSVPIYEIYFLPTLWLFIQNVETTDTICQGLTGWHGQPSAGGIERGREDGGCTEWNFGRSVLNKWITQFMHDEHL